MRRTASLEAVTATKRLYVLLPYQGEDITDQSGQLTFGLMTIAICVASRDKLWVYRKDTRAR